MSNNQQPPLPTLQPGDSHMESLIEAAIQGHASTRDAMRWLVRQLVPAQATQADVTDADIEQVLALAHSYADAKLMRYGALGIKEPPDPAAAFIELRRAILALRPERVPMTDEQREYFLDGYESAQQDALVCRLPPNRLACTRKAGHEGPCAAVPTDDDALVKRGMDRLREAHHGITAQAKKEDA